MFETLTTSDCDCNLTEDYEALFLYIDEFQKCQSEIVRHLAQLEELQNSSHSLVGYYKELYEMQVKNCKDAEHKFFNLIDKAKGAYEKKLKTLKQENEQKFTDLLKKHKVEIEGLQIKNGSDRSDSKFESSNAIVDVKQYENKINNLKEEIKKLKEVTKENEEFRKEIDKYKSKISSLETKNEMLERSKSQQKEKIFDQNNSQRKELENELKKSKEENEKYKKEIAKYKSMVAELEQHNYKPDDRLSSEDSGVGEKDDPQQMKYQLTMNQCELRSLNRKLENKTEICNILRSEVKEAKQKVEEFEKMLEQEKKKLLENSEIITSYKNEIDNSKKIIQNKESEIMNLKLLIDKTNNNLDIKLKEFTEREEKLKKRTTQLSDRNETLVKEIELCKRNNVEMKYFLDKKTIELEKINLENENYVKINEKLKNLNSVLENDFKNLATKIPTVINKQKSTSNDEINSLQNQLIDLQKQNENLLAQLDQLNCTLDEQKQLNLITLEKEKIERNRIEQELEIGKSSIKHLEEKLINLKESHSYKEKCLLQKEQELIRIKEEASGHITQITMLAKEKEDYELNLIILQKEVDRLNSRIEILQKELDSKQEELLRMKFHLSETVTQHKKLFEHIQNRKGSDKKKFFQLPIKTNEMDDKKQNLEKELKREQQKNMFLNEKLNEMIKAYDDSLKEIQTLNLKLKEMKAMKSLDTNYSNKEHEFASHTVKLITTCVSCARSIHFRQKAKRCLNCGATIHSNCNLINNCGLPIYKVRQMAFELDNLSQNSQFNEQSDAEPTAPIIDDDDQLNDNTLDDIESILNDER